MMRRSRIAFIAVGSFLALLLILAMVGVFVARSDWFREKVRQRIVAEVEKATGGRVEIAAFRFDWRKLRAEVDQFVIHGTEPPTAPPLLRAPSVVVVLKIISVFEKKVDIESLDINDPQANLLIAADGSTNIPEPKIKRQTDKTAMEQILDLAIRRFTLQNGIVAVNSKKTPFDARGENLRAQFFYELIGPRYKGDISIQPLHLTYGTDRPLPVNVNLALSLAKNRIDVSSAKLDTAESHVELSGAVADLNNPRGAFQYNVRIALAEMGRTLKLRSKQDGVIQLGGNARFNGTADYLVTGNLHAENLSFRQGDINLKNIRAESAIEIDPKKVALTGIRLSTPEGNFNGRAEILQMDRFRVEGDLSRFDIRRAARLYTRQALPWDAEISGPVRIEGLLSKIDRGDFQAGARLNISPAPRSAPVRGTIEAKYDGRSQTLDLARSHISLPSSNLDLSGVLGKQLRVHLESKNLNDLLPALELASSGGPASLPVKLENGVAIFDGTVTGKLNSPVIAGHLSVTNFVYEQEKVDSLAADIALDRSGAQIRNANIARGNMQAQLAGSVGLHNWKLENNGAVTATAALRNADVKDLLALARQKSLPVTGMLNATANFSGTVGNPRLALDLTVVKGSAYEEPFDKLTAKVDYAGNAVEVATAQLVAGPKQIDLKAGYEHAANNLMNGRLRFQVASNSMPVNQFQIVRKYRPDVLGNVQLNASGMATVAKSKSGQTDFQLAELNANVTAHGLQVEQKKVGDALLTANTTGQILNAHLEVAVAGSNVRGDGHWRLEGDYPGSAQVTFSKIDFAALRAWLASPKSSFNVEGSAEGKLDISGPALKPEIWKASLEIPQLQITPLPGTGHERNAAGYTLRNDGPIRVTMENSVVNIQNARFTGRETNIAIAGKVSLKEKNPLDVRVNGTLDLALLQDFDRDLNASGKVVTDASIRGALTQPLLNGSLQLQKGNFSYASLPNGLSNANGVIRFDGNRAQIESLTAESGGGKITAAGFAALAGGGAAFRLDLTANQVRVRYPEGVSTVADARLNVSGTTERSVLSGSVTILRTGFNPRTDFGSMLARSAEPVRTPSAETGLLGGMQFDIQIETAPDITFQTDIAQDLQADANLRLRGSPSNPVLLGRINITQGDLTFFGNKYTINQGSISFYNPVKLEPILNIDLETKARGVDVTLTLSGPINKLNVSYRSDPPLQFSDIVALLATGRTPTSDPSLVANQSGAAQSWQQMGASALVGQAIANPVAGRLQRLFGVSKIKIDPLLTGVDNPQARLTIEQQVTPSITFTYITNLSNSNPQVIRVEWALNKQWSAVALREENGWFGLDFLYKKRFK